MVNCGLTGDTSRVAAHWGVGSKAPLHALRVCLGVGLRGDSNGGRKESEGSGGGGELHRGLERVRGAMDNDGLELSWTGQHSKERQQNSEQGQWGVHSYRTRLAQEEGCQSADLQV